MVLSLCAVSVSVTVTMAIPRMTETLEGLQKNGNRNYFC